MLYCRSISHQNTPLSIREKLNLSQQDQENWLCTLEDAEAVVLSTCNRLELYAFAESPAAMDDLWASLLLQRGIAAAMVAPYTVKLANFEAANHLLQVTGSLRSMALGEAQILGQVSAAFAQAEKCGTGGHRISMLFRAAIHAAKRVQSETQIGFGNASVSSLGISKVEQFLGSLADRSILVIGAGEMGQAIIKGLTHRRSYNIQLVSRTTETAKQVAAVWNIEARPLTHLKDLLMQVDVVFTTSSAPFPILGVEDIAPIMQERPQHDLYIVDIAVPRDVVPEVASIAGIHLFDVDDLQQVVEANHRERERAVPHAHQIIAEELAKFWQDYQGLSVVPTIRQLRERAEHIRQDELQRIYNKLPEAQSEDVSRLLDEFSHRLMNKILHQPTRNLREKAGQGDGAFLTLAARDLFGLEEA